MLLSEQGARYVVRATAAAVAAREEAEAVGGRDGGREAGASEIDAGE